MIDDHIVAVIMPALNEAEALPTILPAIPAWVDRTIVVDNGSTDATASVARALGARVVSEPRRGYGRACLAGIAACSDADIIVFLDADASDDASGMARLVTPVADGSHDLVLGSRVKGWAPDGVLTFPQRVGNRLSCWLIRRIWGSEFTDLGPYRAVRASSLPAMRLDDTGYGWTVQMQIRGIRAKLRVMEVPVVVRQRIGKSKISGTVRGVLGAGVKILWTIAREALTSGNLPRAKPNPRHVILFARTPVAGEAKTRLIPELGPAGAAALHREMAQHSAAVVARFASEHSTSAEIRFCGVDRVAFAREIPTTLPLERQCSGDLGARIERAIADSFRRGVQSVIVTGTDCPDLLPHHFAEVFSRLNRADVVIVPAFDGGFVALGTRRCLPTMFSQIPWGTRRVHSAIVAAAKACGASVESLAPMGDVDEPADLVRWRSTESHDRWPVVSVVIPTYNEAAYVERAIRSAHGHVGVEVIVVDGESEDATVDVARRAGARVFTSARGRAEQLNVGASRARGSILVFLHADCVLPASFVRLVVHSMSDSTVAIAAFALHIDDTRIRYRWIDELANARSRWLGVPYGDQALTMRVETFVAVGGYRRIEPGEDLDLVRRARRIGHIVTLDASVETSPRRWHREGVIRTSIRHFIGMIVRLIFRGRSWHRSSPR